MGMKTPRNARCAKGLRTPALSAEAMQRIRAAAQQEWRAAHPAEPVRAPARRWLSLAAAASVAVLAGVVGWNVFTGEHRRTVARWSASSRASRRPASSNPTTCGAMWSSSSGSTLLAGQTLDVRGDSLITLAGGGNLRVARASRIRSRGRECREARTR